MNRLVLICGFLVSLGQFCNINAQNCKNNTNDELLLTMLNSMFEMDQRYRQSPKMYLEHAEEQGRIDSINTVKAIYFLEEYGYPSTELMKKSSSLLPILGHSPVYFHDRLKLIIRREFLKGRLSENDYEYLKWHFDGRVGLPNLKGVKINIH